MTDLDKKLKELDIEFLDGVPVKLPDSATEVIKQVFIDQGWSEGYKGNDTFLLNQRRTPEELRAISEALNEPRMTGAEWYAKFEKELPLHDHEIDGERHVVGTPYTRHQALEAARRASGVEMTDSQLLQQLITRAIDGGWKRPEYITFQNGKGDFYFPIGISEDIVVKKFSIRTLLLDHEFAKALWGEMRDVQGYNYFLEGELFDRITPEKYRDIEAAGEASNNWEKYIPFYKNKGWQFHLQQLVIHPKPLDYLREWLEGQDD